MLSPASHRPSIWNFDRFQRSICISLPFESFAYSLHLPVNVSVSLCRPLSTIAIPETISLGRHSLTRQIPPQSRIPHLSFSFLHISTRILYHYIIHPFPSSHNLSRSSYLVDPTSRRLHLLAMQSTIPYTPSVLAPYTFTEINPMALQGYSSAHSREVDPQNKRQRISMACKFCRRR
jgi:hypothetical protein